MGTQGRESIGKAVEVIIIAIGIAAQIGHGWRLDMGWGWRGWLVFLRLFSAGVFLF